MATLILKLNGLAPQSIELKPGSNRLGRSEGNDFHFDDPAVSDSHCEVIVEKDFVLVRDLGSTNGTFIDRQPVQEATLQPGQTLRIGAVEMVLGAAVAHLAIPDLPPPEPLEAKSIKLSDGYSACLNHGNRHAAWICRQCNREYCDGCIRKLRRQGGAYMRFCPACGGKCKLTPWSEAMKRKKKSVFTAFADKVKTQLFKTKLLFAPRKGQAEAEEEPGSGSSEN